MRHSCHFFTALSGLVTDFPQRRSRLNFRLFIVVYVVALWKNFLQAFGWSLASYSYHSTNVTNSSVIRGWTVGAVPRDSVFFRPCIWKGLSINHRHQCVFCPPDCAVPEISSERHILADVRRYEYYTSVTSAENPTECRIIYIVTCRGLCATKMTDYSWDDWI